MYSEPKCRSPDGLGANRPIYGRSGAAAWPLAVPVVAVAVLFFPALAPLLRFDRQGRDRTRFETLARNYEAVAKGVPESAVPLSSEQLEALGGVKLYLAKNSYLSLGAGRGIRLGQVCSDGDRQVRKVENSDRDGQARDV